MKKATLLLTLILSAAIVLAACGNEQSDEPAPEPESTQPQEVVSSTSDTPDPVEPEAGDEPEAVEDDEPQAPAEFFFKIGDVIIELDQNIDYVLSRVGEPIGILELPSCAFEGMDRVFRYSGADLYTYPVGDDDFLYTITFFHSEVQTAEGGIRLGSSLQDVLDAYGDDYELDSGMYTFTRGMTVLEFLIDDDIVIGITYRYLVNV